MKHLSLLLLSLGLPALSMAQGWPANYDGVMLQGFYWDSFQDSKWKNIEAQADELSQYFELIWVPQSGKAQNSPSMGYDVLYYWNQNSSFGTEAQLRSMINALNERGTGVIADVVVNHRGNLSSWVDFPAETYNGVTYEMSSTDIVKNDDGGATAKNNPSVSLSANDDEGEGWDGMRDLDHKSENVQAVVKAYTKYLLDDLKYTGFRYDMVKGFSGAHVADYNQNAGVKFSVGECWDNNSVIKSWIDKTKIDGVPQSAAFDFQFRYTCRDAVAGDWTKLKNASLMTDEAYRQYSVTFVENHDTEKRANAAQDPIKKDTLALNAWMLSMPGTPCIFLKHWQDWKQDIKNMIEVRHLVGIHNLSTYEDFASNKSYFVRKVNGTNAKLAIAVGNYTAAVGSAFQEILSGYHYRYFVEKSLNTVWISTPSTILDEGETLTTTLTAITDGDYEIVYTTDGSEPSATNGTRVTSGTELTISEATSLKAGLLIDGKVVNIQSRNYTLRAPEEPSDYDAWNLDIYVRSEVSSFNTRMNFYIWAGDDNEQLNNSWPGMQITEQIEKDGYQWFHQAVKITSETLLPVNLVFSTGTGSPQSDDVTGVTSESWFVVNDKKDGSKYTVSNVTEKYVGIDNLAIDTLTDDAATYNLQGQRISNVQAGQLYIQGSKKLILK